MKLVIDSSKALENRKYHHKYKFKILLTNYDISYVKRAKNSRDDNLQLLPFTN